MNDFYKRAKIKHLESLIFSGKIFLLLFVLAFGANIAAAQSKSVGKLNRWTFNKNSSREKDDEILPVSYKMRVSKNKNFDRIVFEFEEKEVPEYMINYPSKPITIDLKRVENSAEATKDKSSKIKKIPFILITFALGFDGKSLGEQFSGDRNLPTVAGIETIDWFENFYTFAVYLNAKKSYRVQELSNPTWLVIDFKH